MLRYNKNKFSFQIRNRFSSSKKPEDFSLGGEDGLDETPIQQNPQGISSFIGTPSWSILNFTAAYKLKNNSNLRVGMENIFDIHYREFASGISSSGRNIVLGFNTNF
jgi:hemoglobin/transferrin/lactoferrin receptor protein